MLNAREIVEAILGTAQQSCGEVVRAGLQKSPFQGQPTLVFPSHPHFLKTPH